MFKKLIEKTKSFMWRKKFNICPHHFRPARHDNTPAKVCLTCNTWGVVTRQEFKKLFGCSYSQMLTFYKRNGHDLPDMYGAESVGKTN